MMDCMSNEKDRVEGVSPGVPIMAQQKQIFSIHEDAVSIPGLAHWVEDLVLP